MLKTIASLVGVSLISVSAAAQTAPATEKSTESNSVFKIENFGFEEEVNFFNLDSGNVTEFLQTLTWAVSSDFLTHLSVPVYTDGDTGFGMLDVGADWTFVHSPVSFVDSISVGFDFKLPTSSAGFGGDGVNYVAGLGASGSTGLDKLSWDVAASWEWNTEGDFIPVFGGFTDQDILNAGGGLTYGLFGPVDISVNYNFWQLESGDNLSTIGPAVDWKMCDNAKFNCGVDVPFAAYSDSDLDLIVHCGISLSF